MKYQNIVPLLPDLYPDSDIESELREFCEVKPATVKEWLSGRRMPVGQPKIALFAYLQVRRLRFDEQRNFSKPVLALQQIVGFRILTLDELLELSGYSSKDSLLSFLFARTGATKERENTFISIINDSNSVRAEKLEEYRRAFGVGETPPSRETLNALHKERLERKGTAAPAKSGSSSEDGVRAPHKAVPSLGKAAVAAEVTVDSKHSSSNCANLVMPGLQMLVALSDSVTDPEVWRVACAMVGNDRAAQLAARLTAHG